MGNPAVAIARKLKADSFNAVYEVSLYLHPIGALGSALIVEGAMSNAHEPTPPLDTAEEVLAPGVIVSRFFEIL
jgi:hypothetical protein